MRLKLMWLAAAGITFIIGVASVMVWLRSASMPSTSQQPSVEPQSLRGSERMHLCLKRFDIKLGDSFQHVDSLIPLSHNPNGLNQNLPWLSDFLSLSQPLTAIDEEHEMFTAIYCTFNDQKRLRSFEISWSVSFVDGGNSIKRKMIDNLLKKELTCINGEEIDFKKRTHKTKLDYGDYVEEFEYNFSGEDIYWVSYSASLK